MPRVKIEYDPNGEGPGFLQVEMETWALMLYPQDIEKRLEFVDCLLGKALAEVMPELDREDLSTIDPIMALAAGMAAGVWDNFIATAPRQTKLMAASGVPSIFPGEFAATMLLLPLAAYAQGRKIGRNEVYKAVSGNCTGSHRSLQMIWKKYEAVAHLWAGFLVSGGVPLDEEGLITFLSFAELLRRWASTYVPDRARDTLQSPDAWRLSDDFARPVELPLKSLGISKETLKLLNLKEPTQTACFTTEHLFFTSES